MVEEISVNSREAPTRVLLVDDDPVILNTLSTGLNEAGYAVEACSDAHCAVEHYGKSPPDLAVLDIGLPDMSGTDLAKKLLKQEYRPILVLSSYGDLDIVKQAILSGVEGYLVKPLSVSQLIPSLETSLARFKLQTQRVAAHINDYVVSVDHLSAALDQFPFGVCIVNHKHHPIYRNQFARKLMSESMLTTDVAGRLRVEHNNERFVRLLDTSLGKNPKSKISAVCIYKRDAHRLHAWSTALPIYENQEADALAVVAIFDTQKSSTIYNEVLKVLYGFTPKECKLTNALLQGQTMEEYCERSFVTLNTARTHLKAIFRKTETNRQSELVRLLSSILMPNVASD